jgi:hypothetical protein
MRQLVYKIALTAIGIFAACGGNVVLEGSSSGSGSNGSAGGGGSSATHTTASHNGGSGGASCLNPPDPTTLKFCGGSAAAGGTMTSCAFDFCDSSANTWEALCSGSTCQCKLNGTELCTCALNSPGDICSGAPNCCYAVPTP